MSSSDNTGQEPTIEEILDSIRKIISEDGEGLAAIPPVEAQDLQEALAVAQNDSGQSALPGEAPRQETPEPPPAPQPSPPGPDDDQPLDLTSEAVSEPPQPGAMPEQPDLAKTEAAPQEAPAEPPVSGDDDILDLTETVSEPLPVAEQEEEAAPVAVSLSSPAMPDVDTLTPTPATIPGHDEAAGTPEPEPTPTEPETPAVSIPDQPQVPLEVAMPDATSQDLISETAAAEATIALSKLAASMQQETGDDDVPGSHVTVDQMVRDMMRPMLKEWLDANLPQMVEKIISREIEKLSRKAGL